MCGEDTFGSFHENFGGGEREIRKLYLRNGPMIERPIAEGGHVMVAICFVEKRKPLSGKEYTPDCLGNRGDSCCPLGAVTKKYRSNWGTG